MSADGEKPRLSKFMMVIQELVATETTYINQLSTFIDVSLFLFNVNLRSYFSFSLYN